MKVLTIAAMVLPTVSAIGWNFQQAFHEPQEEVFDYQDKQLNQNCNKYLCPETFACVNSAVDCPCPFPDSQQKCVFSDKSNYVCIPKLSKEDIKNLEKGIEVRDCNWVEKAWRGQV